MKKKQKAPRFFDSPWMAVLAALVPITAVIVGVLMVHLQRPLDPVQLKIHIASIRSLASEGALLSDRAELSPATPDYLRVHSEMLRDEAHDVQAELASSEACAGLRKLKDRAERIAADLTAHLALLSDSDHATSAGVHADFGRLAVEARSAEHEADSAGCD